MKIFLLIFLFFPFLYGNEIDLKLTKEEKLWIKENPTIRVGIYNIPPYIFSDNNKSKGYLIDISNKVFSQLNINPKYSEILTLDEKIKELKNKELDVGLGLIKSSDRENFLNFTDTTMNLQIGIYTRSENKTIIDQNSIKNVKIASYHGYALNNFLKTFENSTIEYVDTPDEMIKLVSTGKADVAIQEVNSTNYIIFKSNYNNIKLKNYINLKTSISTFITQKEDIILKNLIEKSFNAINFNELNSLRKKWFSSETPIFKDNIKAEEKEFLENKKIFTLCDQYDLYPISASKNGKLIGIMGNYTDKISELLNIKFEIISPKSHLHLNELVKTNQCDLVSIIELGQKRFPNIKSSKTIFNLSYASMGNLKSYFLDHNSDYKGHTFFVRFKTQKELILNKYPDMNIVVEKDINEILKKVEKSEFNHYIASKVFIERVIQQNGFDKFKINGVLSDLDAKMAIGVNENQPYLLSSINKIIDSINPEFSKQIINKYSIKEYKIVKEYEFLFYILALLIAIIIFSQFYYIKNIKDKQEREKELLKNLNEARKIAKISSFINDFSKEYYDEVDDSLYEIFEISKSKYPKINREIIFNFIHHEDRDRLRNSILNSYSNSKENQSIFKIVTLNSSLKYLKVYWKIIHDINNKPIKNIVTFQDITQDIIAEKKLNKLLDSLKLERERFELASNATESGIFDWNIKENKLFYSIQWKNLLGYENIELENSFKTWEELTHPEDLEKTKEIIAKYLENKIGFYEAIFRMKHKNQNWIWIKARGKAIFDEEGIATRMIGYHTDITKEVNSNIEKERQLGVIQKQSRLALQGEMLSMIAHQWRQPLNHISILAQSFIRKVRPIIDDKNEIDSFKENILSAINHLSQTINDFTDFYKPDKLKKEFLLTKLYSDTLNIIETRVRNSSIDLTINYDGNENLKLITFKNELSQVLLTIIINSLEAMNNESSGNYIKIDNKLIDDKLSITIEDNAGGISKDIADKIFEPYFSTKEEKNGSGLGLYMAKLIIEGSIQGKIWVESEKNITKFNIKIPCN